MPVRCRHLVQRYCDEIGGLRPLAPRSKNDTGGRKHALDPAVVLVVRAETKGTGMNGINLRLNRLA